MQRNRVAAAVMVGALALGGGAACSDDADEEIVPELEGGEGGEIEGEGGVGGEIEGEVEGDD